MVGSKISETAGNEEVTILAWALDEAEPWTEVLAINLLNQDARRLHCSADHLGLVLWQTTSSTPTQRDRRGNMLSK